MALGCSDAERLKTVKGIPGSPTSWRDKAKAVVNSQHLNDSIIEIQVAVSRHAKEVSRISNTQRLQ